MANVRDLKRDIGYTASELLDGLMLCSQHPDADRQKLDTIAEHIFSLTNEFRMRAQHPEAKDNRQIVRQYYRRLRADFDAGADRIIEELKALTR